ncbi:MAG: HD domain-containing protein [Dissulfurimicrobium sp.]|uniref:HD domain-containing protein n=1 Tax=Dissulfurimicrobium TaxID=1769732 RepID=UPI001EDC8ACE|nr:HD domain-containing protein [Dissulfurimicrobium hydrothermale]UKL13449.1 HD domain-containing protein [Dissulfurimicrobium hydrothermale]
MNEFIQTPDHDTCLDLLKKHGVPDHVIEHSLRVAQAGVFLALNLKCVGHKIDVKEVEAGALLHDIAKIDAIRKGEDHAESGARLLFGLGYPSISGIVRRHVHIDLPVFKDDVPVLTPAHIVNYADKRVCHTSIVLLSERFEDLVERYGTTPGKKEMIVRLYKQTKILEGYIFKKLDFGPQRLCELNAIDIHKISS